MDNSITQTPRQGFRTTHYESGRRTTAVGDTPNEANTSTAQEDITTGGSSPTQIIVIVVAIGGIITVLVSVSVIFMYCIRSRTLRRGNFTGGPKPMNFREMFRRSLIPNRAITNERTAALGSYFARKPAQDVFVGERAGPLTRPLVLEASQIPTRPIAIPERPPRPNRPERTPSTLLHNISKTVSWEVKSHNKSLAVPPELPPTRSPSIHTPTSHLDEVRSPTSLSDGAPLPEPPARPQHFPPRPVTGIPYSSLPPVTGIPHSSLSRANRRSVPTPLNVHQLSAFYSLPEGDLSNITYMTTPDSPATHVNSPLSPPPPARFSIRSWHKAQEEDRGLTRVERLNSLYNGSIGYLRGSQTASSHYNSLLTGPTSVYDPLSDYASYSQFHGNGNLGQSSGISPLYDDRKGKSTYPHGYADIYRNTYGSSNSIMTEVSRLGTSDGRDAALTFLGGNTSFSPAVRYASVRGSGSVNCSKPSLVSLNESNHESESNAEIATGESTEEEHEDGASTVGSRAVSPGSTRRSSGALPDTVRNVSTSDVNHEELTVEGSEKRTSEAESLNSCTTTGSSILYNERGFNLELPDKIQEEASSAELLDLPLPRSLATSLKTNSSDTFGASGGTLRMRTGRGLTAGGFTFPSPWAKDILPEKSLLGQSTPLSATMTAASDSRRVSMSSVTVTETNHTLGPPRKQSSPAVEASSSSSADGNAYNQNARVPSCAHTQSMDALIDQLRKQRHPCECNCSSSSLYSTSTRTKSVKSQNSGKSVIQSQEPPPAHSNTSSRSSNYLPAPIARASITTNLTAAGMSSTTLATSTPGTTVTDLALPPDSRPSSTITSSPGTQSHLPQPSFIFPSRPDPATPSSRHSLPPPLISFMYPPSQLQTPSSRAPSPYPSPTLAYTPSPFSPRRKPDSTPPRPSTRGKHRHYRSNSFSGTTSMVGPSQSSISTTQTPEKPSSSGYRVGSKVMSMIIFPRLSALFGTAKSDNEKAQLQSSSANNNDALMHGIV